MTSSLSDDRPTAGGRRCGATPRRRRTFGAAARAPLRRRRLSFESRGDLRGSLSVGEWTGLSLGDDARRGPAQSKVPLASSSHEWTPSGAGPWPCARDQGGGRGKGRVDAGGEGPERGPGNLTPSADARPNSRTPQTKPYVYRPRDPGAQLGTDPIWRLMEIRNE